MNIINSQFMLFRILGWSNFFYVYSILHLHVFLLCMHVFFILILILIWVCELEIKKCRAQCIKLSLLSLGELVGNRVLELFVKFYLEVYFLRIMFMLGMTFLFMKRMLNVL